MITRIAIKAETLMSKPSGLQSNACSHGIAPGGLVIPAQAGIQVSPKPSWMTLSRA
jgi:hypothetical protein